MTDVRDDIAMRASRYIKTGWIVNVGIGIPTLLLRHLDMTVTHVHSENGLLGVGPPPAFHEVDPNLVDAGKQPVTVTLGCVYFDSAQSFGMVRGGHIDAAVMGALQVDHLGRIANWFIPGRPVLGVGGAMDLMEGAREVIIVMQHLTRDGRPKIVKDLTLPRTSIRSADVLVTDLATFHIDAQGLVLTELASGTSVSKVRECTGANFEVAQGVEDPSESTQGNGGKQ